MVVRVGETFDFRDAIGVPPQWAITAAIIEAADHRPSGANSDDLTGRVRRHDTTYSLHQEEPHLNMINRLRREPRRSRCTDL